MRIEREIPGSEPKPGPDYELCVDEFGSYWTKKYQDNTPLIPWQKALLATIVFALGATFGGMIVQIHTVNVSDAKSIKEIERELLVNYRLEDRNVRNLRIHRDSDGSLVASFYEGGDFCEAIPLRPPHSQGLWSTEDCI